MIDPRGFDVKQWTDAAALTLGSYGVMPVLHDPYSWIEWAEIVISFPAVSNYSPPDPRHFVNWDQWAQRFVEAVPL